jgi:hypothetical protein
MGTTTEAKRQEPLVRGHIAFPRSLHSGWMNLTIGILFVLVSIYWTVNPLSANSGYWLGMKFVMAAFIPLCCVFMIWMGVRDIRQDNKVKKGKATQFRTPWLWDFDWNSQGDFKYSSKKEKLGIFAMAFIGIFLVTPITIGGIYDLDLLNGKYFDLPFLGQVSKKSVFLYGAIAFNAYWLLSISYKIYKIWTGGGRCGYPSLRFKNFPFFLGDTLSIVLEGLPARADRLTLHLRFMEEIFRKNPMNGKFVPNINPRTAECYEIFKETRVLARAQFPPENKPPVQWNLPDNTDFVSILREGPARFWELEVIAETPSGDCQNRYLLPIYASV